MKRAWIFLSMIAVLGLSLCSQQRMANADPSVLVQSGILASAGTSSSCVANSTTGTSGSCVQLQCPAGQSSAVVYVPAGTLSGVVTIYTAPDVGGVPGVFGTPFWVTSAGGTAQTQTLSAFPGKLVVTLGSEQWVEAVLTTATSGQATAQITCSGAVARVGNAFFPTAPPSVAPSSTPNGFVIAWATPPAAPAAQTNANISIDGIVGFGGASPQPSAPAPVVSESPGAYLSISQGASKGWVLGNLTDVGDFKGNGATTLGLFLFNNQGTSVSADSFSRTGAINAVGGGGYTTTSIVTPAAPSPTCAPGGANAPTQYFVNVNYIGVNGQGISSPEATVTCAANTLLQVPAPPVVAGASQWTVNASLVTNTEKAQTQGTSPTTGTALTFTQTPWTSTATLAGATAFHATDNTASSSTLAALTLYQLPNATPAPLCGGNAAKITQCNSDGNGPVPFAVATTTPTGCTAFVACMTVTETFPTAFTAAPNCPAPSVLDSTTPATLWIGNVKTIGTGSVVFNIAPVVTFAASARTISLTDICELF